MKLNDIRDNAGSHKRFKRVGRGSGSGKGKTAGRGVKGQKARAGHHGMNGFEGGQMPLHMRLPKRGFTNIFAADFSGVNLGDVQRAIEAGKIKAAETITETVLRAAGLGRKSADGIRLLGKGELKTKASFELAGASRPAIAAVEKLGGSVKTTYVKKTFTKKDGTPGKRQQRRTKSAEKRAARGAAA
jgi:large subunit ribosomal protein L15